MYSLPIGCDKLIWLPLRALYSVKNASEKLMNLEEKVSWDFIWHLKTLQKIKIFLWKLILKILPKKELLIARGIIKDEPLFCSLCHISRESVDHLFLKCEVARFLWDGIIGCTSTLHYAHLEVGKSFSLQENKARLEGSGCCSLLVPMGG